MADYDEQGNILCTFEGCNKRGVHKRRVLGVNTLTCDEHAKDWDAPLEQGVNWFEDNTPPNYGKGSGRLG